MRTNQMNWFWNCAGLALLPLSIGVSWSLIRASNFKLEAATHKLEVNTAVEQGKKVLDTVEQSVELLPPTQKQVVQQQLEKANHDLVETQRKILSDEDDTENLES